MIEFFQATGATLLFAGVGEVAGDLPDYATPLKMKRKAYEHEN